MNFIVLIIGLIFLFFFVIRPVYRFISRLIGKLPPIESYLPIPRRRFVFFATLLFGAWFYTFYNGTHWTKMDRPFVSVENSEGTRFSTRLAGKSVSDIRKRVRSLPNEARRKALTELGRDPGTLDANLRDLGFAPLRNNAVNDAYVLPRMGLLTAFAIVDDRVSRPLDIHKGWISRLARPEPRPVLLRDALWCGFEFQGNARERVCFAALQAPVFAEITAERMEPLSDDAFAQMIDDASSCNERNCKGVAELRSTLRDPGDAIHLDISAPAALLRLATDSVAILEIQSRTHQADIKERERDNLIGRILFRTNLVSGDKRQPLTWANLLISDLHFSVSPNLTQFGIAYWKRPKWSRRQIDGDSKFLFAGRGERWAEPIEESMSAPRILGLAARFLQRPEPEMHPDTVDNLSDRVMASILLRSKAEIDDDEPVCKEAIETLLRQYAPRASGATPIRRGSPRIETLTIIGGRTCPGLVSELLLLSLWRDDLAD